MKHLSTNWMNQGSCRDIPVADKDQWFFSQDPSTVHKDRVKARQVCSICPVKLQCAMYAIINKEGADSHSHSIVWGGMVYRERLEFFRSAKKNNEWDGLVEESKIYV